MAPTRFIVAPACLLTLTALTACSDSADDAAPAVQSNYSTDSLDSLAPAQSEPEPQPETAPTVIDQSAPASEPTEEEREWVRERESQSNYGRTRDRVKTLTNRLQDGTEADDGLADVTSEEEWAGTGGLRWDMPADWRMAVPADGRFGQMLVPSPLGAASVAFTRESATVAELERRVGSMIVSLTGGRVSPRTDSFETLGRSVKTLAMEGTLLDPTAKGGTGETPFAAVRAAIVDLGDARALIVLWGPEDTVRNNEAKFESMVRNVSER
jgi:hypothetical protein